MKTRPFLLSLLILLFWNVSQSQIANDACVDAISLPQIDTCFTMLNGQEFTLEGATPQGRHGFCTALASNANNAWFSFVRNACFIEISAIAINSSVDDLEISLFTACDINPVACSPNSVVIPPIANANMFISITSASNTFTPFELCLNTTAAPSNDSFLNAENVISPSNTCTTVTGTTKGACPSRRTSDCSLDTRAVYYKTLLEEGQSGIRMELTSDEITEDITIEFGTLSTLDVVRFFPIYSYCGPADTSLIYSGLNSYFEDYILKISTNGEDAGAFEFCIGSIPSAECASNDFCEQAILINNLTTNDTEVCLQGCNRFAFGADFENSCVSEYEETVWYKIIPDTTEGFLSLSYSSASLNSLNVTLFEGLCYDLNYRSCLQLTNNDPSQVLNYKLQDSVYYLAISDPTNAGGDFELCVSSIIIPNSCVANATIEAIQTSMGSPLNGPYLPDEVVEFRYAINEYRVSQLSEINNCAWLQGIVPIYGNGWDPNSFTPTGEPEMVSQPIAQYRGAWDWFDSISFNFETALFTVGNFDNDPELELCSFWEAGCSNAGIQAGTILPPGWFAVDTAQGSSPNRTFGDGAHCDTVYNGWEVTFQLKARSFNNLIQDSSQLDCSVKMYTLSDGHTGAWIGPEDLCKDDRPAILQATLKNCQSPQVNFTFEQMENSFSFENSSSNFDSCRWDFGDGNTSADINPVHEYDTTGIFYVQLICFNDCSSDTLMVKVETLVSQTISFTFIEDLKVSPNPNRGVFNIDIKGVQSNEITIELLSLNGSSRGSTHTYPFGSGILETMLDYQSQPNGIYYLKISTAQKKPVFKKIIIQH